jgi:hypothetical protein
MRMTDLIGWLPYELSFGFYRDTSTVGRKTSTSSSVHVIPKLENGRRLWADAYESSLLQKGLVLHATLVHVTSKLHSAITI